MKNYMLCTLLLGVGIVYIADFGNQWLPLTLLRLSHDRTDSKSDNLRKSPGFPAAPVWSPVITHSTTTTHSTATTLSTTTTHSTATTRSTTTTHSTATTRSNAITQPIAITQSTHQVANTTTLNTRFFSDSSYRSNLAQYNKGLKKPPRAKLEFLQPHNSSYGHGKQKSKCKVGALHMEYKVVVHGDRLDFTVTVAAKKHGSPVTGCSFLASQVFTTGGEKRKMLCNSYDYFNGNYSITCINPFVADCVQVQVKVIYCDFEAFKTTRPYNRKLVDDRFCFSNESSGSSFEQRETVVSWSLDAHNKCKDLYFNNVVQKPLSDKEVCECVGKYDAVYLVGASHIGQFADYIMHTCSGLNLTGKANGLNHGNLHAGNLYYEVGRYSKDVYQKLQQNLTSWLHNSSRVALCIQIGSWDMVRMSITYGLEVALVYYEQLIVYLQSRIKETTSRVDLHILATPPLPDGHVVDRIAISVFNTKLQQITEKHQVSFIDMFAVLDPCANDTPKLGKNHHHYVQGLGNKFAGTAGMAFYRGVFLPKLCPLLSSSSAEKRGGKKMNSSL